MAKIPKSSHRGPWFEPLWWQLKGWPDPTDKKTRCMSVRRERLNYFYIAWHCASEKIISPVKITRCVQMVKIKNSVIRNILGWFWWKISTKKSSFSILKLKSLRRASNTWRSRLHPSDHESSVCMKNEKMKNFKNCKRIKNHVRENIFFIFHFQKSPPIWGNCRV